MLKFALNQRPSSKWVVAAVVATSFYVDPLNDFPIGCCEIDLPSYIKDNDHILSLVGDQNGEFKDNLCFFRCLALHQGGKVFSLEKQTKQLFKTWGGSSQGVTLKDIPDLERLFSVNVEVF